MDVSGRSPTQILENRILDSSSWHFFQARSWLDYARRTQRPSAIHYAAFELRYGIECLIFELLLLTNKSLTMGEYEKCLGEPREMKKMLSSLGTNYHRLVEFTEIALALEHGAPKLSYWNISELFKYWGIASEFLHFVGVQSLTYRDVNWIITAIARLESPLDAIWKTVTETVGPGVYRPSQMPPEVHAAWEEFASGRLSKTDLGLRLTLIQPMLQSRRA